MEQRMYQLTAESFPSKFLSFSPRMSRPRSPSWGKTAPWCLALAQLPGPAPSCPYQGHRPEARRDQPFSWRESIRRRRRRPGEKGRNKRLTRQFGKVDKDSKPEKTRKFRTRSTHCNAITRHKHSKRLHNKGPRQANNSSSQHNARTSRARPCPTKPAAIGNAVPSSLRPNPLTCVCVAIRCRRSVDLTSSILMEDILERNCFASFE